jgi:acetoin utilization protein AcuB
MKPSVGDYMTHHPHTVGKEQPIEIAHRFMQHHHIRHLPVLEAGKLVGLVSQRDLHLIETLSDVDPAKTHVEEAMTQDVYITTAETPLEEVAANMAEHKYGSAVITEGSKIAGVFTTVDALRALANFIRRSTP